MDYLEKMSEFQSSAKDDFIISDSMALIFKCINNSKFVQYSSELWWVYEKEWFVLLLDEMGAEILCLWDELWKSREQACRSTWSPFAWMQEIMIYCPSY